MNGLKRGRVIRVQEVTPAALIECQQRYATLLRDYISLAESHVSLLQRYHELLDRRQTRDEVEV